MHYFDSTTISESVYLHQVGNKSNDEPLVLSNNPLELTDTIKKDLKQYFLSHFKPTEYSCFEHDASLSLNEVYSYVSAIFENQENLAQQSKYLAQSLYRKGVHPNIKGGEFYVVYFKNCLLDGEMTDAVGLFKSENKDSFLKVQRNGDRFEILQELGVNINKLDKGCLIFNTNKEDGYVVSVVDNSNRGEAKYWVEDFLQVKRKNDSYTQTQNAMTMCKNFISQLPSDIDKADKAAMMNRVVEGLKQESVSIDSVASKAFGPELSTGFNSFRNEYQKTHDVRFDESFQGKPESIKRRAVGTITTIKLDKNFDVNIHGGEQYIERGYDENRGMRYYKLFFNEEK